MSVNEMIFESAMETVQSMFPKRRAYFCVTVTYNRPGDTRSFHDYVAEIQNSAYGVDHYYPEIMMLSGVVMPQVSATFTFIFGVNLDMVPGWGYDPADWVNLIHDRLTRDDPDNTDTVIRVHSIVQPD